jgi:hypothetical protein
MRRVLIFSNTQCFANFKSSIRFYVPRSWFRFTYEWPTRQELVLYNGFKLSALQSYLDLVTLIYVSFYRKTCPGLELNIEYSSVMPASRAKLAIPHFPQPQQQIVAKRLSGYTL